MARHENDFRAEDEAPLSLNELLAMLRPSEGDDRSKREAMTCFLSGDDGWREAMKILNGAFAEESSGLKERKSD